MEKIGDWVKRIFSNKSNTENAPALKASSSEERPRDYWVGTLNTSPSRRTVTDLTKLGSSMTDKWFDGQAHYEVDRRPKMSSDSWARLESFLRTRGYDESSFMNQTGVPGDSPQSSHTDANKMRRE